jgi:hypothetical protein
MNYYQLFKFESVCRCVPLHFLNRSRLLIKAILQVLLIFDEEFSHGNETLQFFSILEISSCASAISSSRVFSKVFTVAYFI